MDKKKYVIHSGYINSKTDDDLHLITCSQLISLYGVNPRFCILVPNDKIFNKRGYSAERLKDFIHLYPNYDGNYKL